MSKTNQNEQTKPAGGRPSKEIDWEIVKRLASIHCTAVEIASVIGFTERNLQLRCLKDQKKHISKLINEASQGGRASLRRWMWSKAEGKAGELYLDARGKPVFDEKGRAVFKILPLEPDTTMQIWLSKNVLGYTDKQEFVDKEGKTLTPTFLFTLPNGAKINAEEMAKGGGKSRKDS